jgi:hypothetical protein
MAAFRLAVKVAKGPNRGSGTPQRDAPYLTACEPERLTTRDMAGNPTRRTCHPNAVIWG